MASSRYDFGTILLMGVIALTLMSRSVEAQPSAGGGAGGQAPATGVGPGNVNRVYFRGTPEEISEIEEILSQNDRLPSQILLELYLLDVNITRNDSAGMNMEFFFGPTRNLSGIPLGGYETNGLLQQSSGSLRFGSLSTERYRLFFNYLKDMTDTRILARPSLMVLNGQEARLNLGGQRRFVTGAGTQQGGFGGGTSSSLQTEQVNVGQNLAVIPRILPNDIIFLNIQFDDTQIAQVQDFTSSIGNIQLPETSRRAMSTPLMVRSRGAIVIGGLKSDTNRRSSNKIPLLGSLPFIGRNFGNNQKSNDSRELLIVLKATAIRPEELLQGTPSNARSTAPLERTYGEL